MIHFEDNAREALLIYLQKPRKKLELPLGKANILGKYKKDRIGKNIYIIDYDDNGIPDEEIENSLNRLPEFSHIGDVLLFTDKILIEKYILIFKPDFPTWLLNALKEIGKRPFDFGFSDKKGKLHIQIRDKNRINGFNSMLKELNKNNSSMLDILKDIFNKINHKV